MERLRYYFTEEYNYVTEGLYYFTERLRYYFTEEYNYVTELLRFLKQEYNFLLNN